MSEELLKAIIRLFAIVARERVTEDERANVKQFLSTHLNYDSIGYYLQLFDGYCTENARSRKDLDVDDETLTFVDDWSRIMAITRQVNQALTMPQKVIIVAKILELIFINREISERQENLIFYIGEALKLSGKDTGALKAFAMGENAGELSSDDVLIIGEGTGTFKTEGLGIIEKNLAGFIAIFRLEEVETYFVRYIGGSTLWLNGIPVKSRKINVFPAGSTLRGDKITPIYYSDVVSRFLRSRNKAKITFSAEHLFYHFNSGRAGLQNVSFGVEGGKLVGIMGSSGSGKSTLLNVINGSEMPSGGRVIINNINIHDSPELVEGVIGYVPQDDLLIEELTVFQNLYYAARLCFGHHCSAETGALVDKVLLNLGLSDIRALKVGSPLEKTISGGQRKRVNIGLELLREPRVLYVDEPTSGLSSRDSENIMDLLKELSLKGKMVFVVIHQPSSDIFRMFDELLILDLGGLPIYFGNPVESITYFKEVINAANRSDSTCPECGNINPEQLFNIIETRVVNEFGRLTTTRKVSPGQWYQYFKERLKPAKIRHTKERIRVTQQIPGLLRQLRVFVTRDVLSKFSDKQYLWVNLLQAPLLALFMAFLVRYYPTIERDNPAYSFYENDNIPVYFFMSIIVALFMGLTVSAEEIFRDRKILRRERFLNLSKGSYLVSKVLILFALSAIQTASFVAVGNFTLGLADMGLRLWLILFSCSCFSNLLGLNISATFKSAVTIYILIPLLLIPQLLLSGVVIRFDKFNPRVSRMDGVPIVGEMMASRWAFEATLVTQFKDNPYERQFFDMDKRMADAEYKKLYYIPRLKTELSNVLVHMHDRFDPDVATSVENSLTILRNELAGELRLAGADKFRHTDRLEIGKFDSLTYRSAKSFLDQLQRMYAHRYLQVLKQKEQFVERMTDTPQKRRGLDSMKIAYRNAAIVDLLMNNTTPFRVVAQDGHLIRRIAPIYFTDHRPAHFFDCSSRFYVPVKHFAGYHIDTLYFNMLMIWAMTALLFVTLYFDGLRLFLRWVTYRRVRRKL